MVRNNNVKITQDRTGQDRIGAQFSLDKLPSCQRLSEIKDISIQSLINGDSLKVLKELPDNSFHACFTDPPYFIDGMDNSWNANSLKTKASKAGVIGSLPVGMKFDPKQGIEFEKFMTEISKEIYRILKPGGFYVAFSQARLYHRLGVAAENAGFEIRDMFGWIYEGQAKAFSQSHFIEKDKKLTRAQKDKLIAELENWKTPQLKPMIEPMILAQKPKEGTFVENWVKHRVGLVNTQISLDSKFPGNLMAVRKPSKEEKGENNDHFTVKPTLLMEHLIQLLTPNGSTIIDPFLGSGTTAIAAKNTGRNCVGIEINSKYFDIASKRVGGVK